MAVSKEKQYCNLLTPIVCDGCGEQNNVSFYCLQCPGNICDKCKSTHCKTRLTRKHIVLPRTHPEVLNARRSQKIYCKIHKGRELVTYCMKCKQPCCATCISQNHDGHNFSDIEKQILQTESDVDALVLDLETNLIPHTENAILNLEEEITGYKKAMDDFKHSANERKIQQIQDLTKTYEAALSEAHTRGERDIEVMERKKREFEGTLDRIRTVALTGKTAPADASIFSVRDEVEEISLLKPSLFICPGTQSFSPSNLNISKSFGCISKGLPKVFFIPFIHDVYRVRVQKAIDNVEVSSVHFDVHRVRVQKAIDKVEVSSVICTDDNVIWIRENHTDFCTSFTKELHIYDENFTKKRTLKLDFFCEDITFYSNYEVLAIGNGEIFKVSGSGRVTSFCRTEEMLSGVFVNNKQEIVVAELKEEDHVFYNWKLVVYSPNGSILREIEDDSLFNNNMGLPQVKQTLEGDYVITIGGKIICLSGEWKVKWVHEFKIDDYGGSAICPLCCDKNNNILVGDIYSKTVVLFSVDGERKGTLLQYQDGIRGIRSMDIDSKGRLLIGQKNNLLIVTYGN